MKKQLLMALLVTSVALPAMAADVDPNHPRVNEVQNRIDNQEGRVNQEEANGKITATQAQKDDAKLANEQTRLNADEAKNNGHITKAEDKNLNHSLNNGNRRDRHQIKKDAGTTSTTVTPAN